MKIKNYLKISLGLTTILSPVILTSCFGAKTSKETHEVNETIKILNTPEQAEQAEQVEQNNNIIENRSEENLKPLVEEKNEISSQDENKVTNSDFQYDPEISSNVFDNNHTVFVRPPFGVRFALKNNSDNKIVTVFDHLDSPKASKREIRFNNVNEIIKHNVVTKSNLTKRNGAQEVSEFLAIPRLLDTYLNASSQKDLVIFGGDTNINNANYYLARLFKDPKKIDPNWGPEKPQIKSVLDYDLKLKNTGERYETSLGEKGNYANQYDKLFYINQNENFEVKDIKDNSGKDLKIDIYKAFDILIDKNEYKQFNKYGNDNKFIRNFFSDHAPIYVDVKLKNSKIESLKTDEKIFKFPNANHKKEEDVIRISHWNILNYGKDDLKDEKLLAKAKVIGTIIYKSGFDITGLTEINDGKGESVKLIVDTMNKLANEENRFKFVLQDANKTKIKDKYLNDPKFTRFGQAQQEQVAIIYDSKNFDPVNFDKTKLANNRETNNLSYLLDIKHF